MLVVSEPPVGNVLLAALPREEYARLVDDLDAVQVKLGDVLYEPGERIRHLYFPNDCLIALLAVTDEHMTLEVGLVGREGMVGIPAAPGNGISQVRAIVQRPGTAIRIKLAHFNHEFQQYSSLQRALNQNTQTMLLQAIQIAVCSRFHVLESRLARSLLMTRDRLVSDQFHLTHEFLSRALGARRAGVTKAASALQQQGLICYSRGEIKIIDGVGLEAASCACYKTVKI